MEDQGQLLEEDTTHERQALYKSYKLKADMYDKITEELVEQMSVFKEIDAMHEKSGKAQMFKDIKYVDREVDEEIKAGFD